jgi:hypothetical protein
MEGFGQQLERSATTFESNVLQAQQFKREAEVNTAVSDSIQKSGDLVNEFRQLPGSQAQDALQQHIEALRASREAIRNSLSSPAAQRDFDRETMHRFALDVVGSSQYAAQQMRAHTKQAISNNSDQIVQDTARRAREGDPEAVEKGTEKLKANEHKLGIMEGEDAAGLAKRDRAAVTRMISAITSPMSTYDPERAQKILDQAKKTKSIDETQVEAIQQKVDAHEISFHAMMDGAAIASNRIQQDPTAFTNNPEGTRIQMRQDAEKRADELYPNDPFKRQQYLDEVTRNIEGKANVAQKDQNDRTRDLKQSVMGLAATQMSNGRKPISMAEMNTLNPKAQDYYDEAVKRDPTMALRMQHAFLANSKEDNILRPEQINAMGKWWAGLKTEEKQRVDPNAYFNAGKINNQTRDKWSDEQNKLTSAATNTNAADTVLSHYKATLNDQQIFESKTDTEANNRYAHLRGALQLKIEEEQQKLGRPVKAWTPEEERRVVNQLMEETKTGERALGGYGWEITKPRYEIMYERQVSPPKPDWVNKLAPDAVWSPGAGRWQTTINGQLVNIRNPEAK